MNHFIILALLALVTNFAQAQKTKYDKKSHEVTVDGDHVFNIIRTCDHGQNCRFDVFDLSGKKVIRINYLSFKSIVEVTQSNPKGTVNYLEFIFIASEKKAEYDSSVINPKWVANVIVINNLIQNGELNEEAMDEFILTNGTRFSERIRL